MEELDRPSKRWRSTELGSQVVSDPEGMHTLLGSGETVLRSVPTPVVIPKVPDRSLQESMVEMRESNHMSWQEVNELKRELDILFISEFNLTARATIDALTH
jgi:hypothetical protein